MNNSETPLVMSQNVFYLFDAITFIASITSLILAILAIWLTLSFKRDADKTNRQTSELLTEIKAESKYISQGVMSELKAYGDSMRGAFTQNTSTQSSSITSPPTDFNVSINSEK